MRVTFNVEYELTKDVIYNIESNEPMEEYTYVVPAEWLSKLYYKHIVPMFDYDDCDLNEFLDVYDPEVEGTVIYHIAAKQQVIIEEGWSEVAEY